MAFLESVKTISKRYRLFIVVAIAMFGAVLFGARWYYGPSVDAYEATRSNVVQTIVASGRVETPLRVNIGTQVTGTVASIPVAEGQTVKAGQILFTLEDGEFKAAVEQARAAVMQAQMRVRQLRDVTLPTAQQNLHQSRINLQNAERQYRRTKELFDQKFVGQAQLDDAEQKRDLAHSQLHTAELQVATNSAGGADIMMAQAALDQAQANLRVAQSKLGYAHVAAPADGVLIARDVERGDVVQPGRTLFVLSPSGKTQLVVQIDEKNLAQVRTGQHALASADAFPDRSFPADLVYINPAVDAQRGSVEVKLDVPSPPDYLRQDMTVSVDVEVARRQAAIVAPFVTVHDSAGTEPWVMKVVNGRATRQPVALGLRGLGMVEMLSGVQPGDVLLPALALIPEGKRVRAAPKPFETKRGP